MRRRFLAAVGLHTVIALGGLSCGDGAPATGPEPGPTVQRLFVKVSSTTWHSGAILIRVTATPPRTLTFRATTSNAVVFYREVSDHEVRFISIGGIGSSDAAPITLAVLSASDLSDLTAYSAEILEASASAEGTLLPTASFQLSLTKTR